MSLEWTPERENWNLSLGLTPKLFELKLEKELVRRYYDRVFEYVNFPEDTIVLSAPFVYTPLHGVGLKYFDHLVCRLTRRDNRKSLPFLCVTCNQVLAFSTMRPMISDVDPSESNLLTK